MDNGYNENNNGGYNNGGYNNGGYNDGGYNNVNNNNGGYANGAYNNGGYNNYPIEQPNVLVWGILSCALCWIPVIGIVFASLGLSKAGQCIQNGCYYGQAKVGKIFSIIGLVCSIIANIYWTIACGFICAYSSYR